ncbi:Mitochondrial glycoprotein [Parasponia andersonii]|uniref:Mitochondrial glycoprotein n=1 Tax=Parasponia andersonii TaxID=3476 RepID=A0A2P5E2P7_PARAD|nr:Mitochondrial glycoprotein [Parasponia andersonii]
MWKKVLSYALQNQPWRMLPSRTSTSTTVSSAVNAMLLRSLKEHYLEVSKMSPPPKVNPPSPFTIVKGALDGNGPVLRRSYGEEEISISVMRLANIIPGVDKDGDGDIDGDGDDDVNQLFLHVDVSKPGQAESLHFLCGLYPDALGIHSVSMRPKVDTSASDSDSASIVVPSTYNGPVFEDIDERMRDAFHGYIEERGINDSLFPFLQAWLYVKDHRNLMRWFKSVGTFINENESAKEA